MKNKSVIEKIIAVLFALAVWQILAMAIGESLILVTPITVVRRLCSLIFEIDFISSVAFSFVRIVSGFIIALIFGSVLAIFAGRFRAIDTLLWPFMTAIKTIPVASFIILCLIWLSSKNLSIFISFLMVLPIVYTNMLSGIRNTDKKLLEMTSLFRVGFFRKLKYVYLPQIYPYLISALSVSIGLSWKAGVAAEVIGIPSGSIGEKLYEAKIYLSSGDLFAWTVVIVLISILFEKLFLFLMRQLFGRMVKS